MILDKPVKTYLMQAVKTSIEGITLIRQVKYGQGIPLDQDIALYPWVCFFDETETKKDRNRITEKTFDLVVQVWVRKGIVIIEDQMDLIDAEIELMLLNDLEIKKYCRSILPDSADKFVIDDQETGIIQSVFKILYCHAWKNPYELPKII